MVETTQQSDFSRCPKMLRLFFFVLIIDDWRQKNLECDRTAVREFCAVRVFEPPRLQTLVDR